jgi:hypothetical protein
VLGGDPMRSRRAVQAAFSRGSPNWGSAVEWLSRVGCEFRADRRVSRSAALRANECWRQAALRGRVWEGLFRGAALGQYQAAARGQRFEGERFRFRACQSCKVVQCQRADARRCRRVRVVSCSWTAPVVLLHSAPRSHSRANMCVRLVAGLAGCLFLGGWPQKKKRRTAVKICWMDGRGRVAAGHDC